ncbi:MAG: DEAD/DEAH box helicase [Betaproteobacteria bacterium]|nr:DEAD/DEAH box helicase [Betaproteobacteria bacterium]MDH5349571.1 DEAD/DEAH box helicase [Betaproteobacteria bacterium]
MASSSFDQLGLIPPLAQAVRELGYEQPTPVQEQAIPLVLAGRDLMAGAQTGTGKTAAFALPILQRLAPQASTSASPARHPVRVLVLTPTRELAIQVEQSFKEYGKHLPLRSAVVYGGADMDAQIRELRRGVEVLVATPGRLLDHVQSKTVMLNQVGILTLDEADRMLDMGFLPDIRRIIALLPKERQNLLFSATFPDEIRTLVKSLLRNPAEVQIAARNAVADLVTHVVHPVAREKKRELLSYLVQTRNLQQVLVFCGTRIGANRLAHQLRKDRIHADAIHGDKSQAERLVALENFKAGKSTVLVATDVASRGLDIEGLPQVINFDIPHSPEDYVHRIGRTGRAGLTGEAISLVAPPDMEALAAIERLIKKKIDRVLVPGFQPDGGTAATLMGRESRPASRRGEAPRATAPRPAAPRPQRPQGDPIFSKPYEPSAAPAAAAPKAEESSQQSKRRRPQVAALLGGLKRA